MVARRDAVVVGGNAAEISGNEAAVAAVAVVAVVVAGIDAVAVTRLHAAQPHEKGAAC